MRGTIIDETELQCPSPVVNFVNPVTVEAPFLATLRVQRSVAIACICSQPCAAKACLMHNFGSSRMATDVITTLTS